MLGDPWGTHRASNLRGPSAACAAVDNDFARSFASEMLLAVETLNVDAASFRQMETATGGAAKRVLRSSSVRPSIPGVSSTTRSPGRAACCSGA